MSLCLTVIGCGGGGSDSAPSGAASATLAGTLAFPAAKTSGAEFEPNNSPLTPNSLGTLEGASLRVAGRLDPQDPVDFFWLVESSSGRVNVTLDRPESVALELTLYDVLPDGSAVRIARIAGAGIRETIVYETPEPSVSEPYVTVVAVVHRGGQGEYELSIWAENQGAAGGVRSSGQPRSLVYASGDTGDRVPSPETGWGPWGPTEGEVVPGEVLVRWKPQAGRSRRSVAGGGLRISREVPGFATVLEEISPEPGEAGRAAAARSRAGRLRRTAGRVLRLRADPRVEMAVPNYVVGATAVPNDPLYGSQWHYAAVGLPEAWELSTGGDQVVVAVLDTGITAHPDLAGRVTGGFDFVSDPYFSLDGDGPDPDPTDPGDGDGPVPSTWHGTHVAGTIGASTDDARGVAGVDWGCRVLPVRVLGLGGSGTLSDVLDGILYAAGLENSSGTVPPQPAKVINMSFSAPDPAGDARLFLQPVIDAAREAGVLLVGAVGNDGSDGPRVPSSCRGVLGVGAVDRSMNRAWYSNFGTDVDLAAPGGDGGTDLDGDGNPDGVLSTLVDPATGEYGYGFLAGTSMAAPHVSGVASLCLAANPDLGLEDLEDILLSTAIDLGLPGRDDDFGHGLVDAGAAVAEAVARRGAGVAPVLDPGLGSSALSFGDTDTERDLVLTNLGGGTLTVSGLTTATEDGAGWLRAALVTATPATVRVEVERAGLAPGEYSGEVQVLSTGGARAVPVRMEVSNTDDVLDLGSALVRLLDPPTGRTIREVATHLDRGYAYEFSAVPPGSYLLVAGIDPDGDGTICEAGEYCAAYPNLGAPQPVVVSAGETWTDMELMGEFARSSRVFP
ncbi:MAG: S8 family serine peptidase [Deferrisomatales bacterium]|nr:S8 family serine peptidase [Deferrisomatales bacterium]